MSLNLNRNQRIVILVFAAELLVLTLFVVPLKAYIAEGESQVRICDLDRWGTIWDKLYVNYGYRQRIGISSPTVPDAISREQLRIVHDAMRTDPAFVEEVDIRIQRNPSLAIKLRLAEPLPEIEKGIYRPDTERMLLTVGSWIVVCGAAFLLLGKERDKSAPAPR